MSTSWSLNTFQKAGSSRFVSWWGGRLFIAILRTSDVILFAISWFGAQVKSRVSFLRVKGMAIALFDRESEEEMCKRPSYFTFTFLECFLNKCATLLPVRVRL